jgi:hypothetical protein
VSARCATPGRKGTPSDIQITTKKVNGGILIAEKVFIFSD